MSQGDLGEGMVEPALGGPVTERTAQPVRHGRAAGSSVDEAAPRLGGVPSPAPSASAVCIASVSCIRRMRAAKAISLSGLSPTLVERCGLGNTSRGSSPRTVSRTASASGVSGTRCSRPAFIRDPGTVHSALPKSTSPRSSRGLRPSAPPLWRGTASRPPPCRGEQKGQSTTVGGHPAQARAAGLLGHLARLRQRLREMSAPPRRVVARAVAVHGRPRQHALYPPPKARSRLGPLVPHWSEDAQHVLDVDLVHPLRAEHLRSLGERRTPLHACFSLRNSFPFSAR